MAAPASSAFTGTRIPKARVTPAAAANCTAVYEATCRATPRRPWALAVGDARATAAGGGLAAEERPQGRDAAAPSVEVAPGEERVGGVVVEQVALGHVRGRQVEDLAGLRVGPLGAADLGLRDRLAVGVDAPVHPRDGGQAPPVVPGVRVGPAGVVVVDVDVQVDQRLPSAQLAADQP